MSQRFSRFFAIFLLAVSAVAMLSVSFDAEARRFGGGRSFGRQSSNIMKQRQAVTPPAASTAPRAAAPAAGARAGAAASSTARSGLSRWLGPIAGIAAGLGIAALLSSLGLSGAFLEMMSSLILIGLLVFGVMYIVRRLRGGAARPATQGASPMQRQSHASSWQQSRPTPQAPATAAPSTPSVAQAPAAEPVDESWFIPENFDTPGFLANAKAQFTKIQAVWDSGDMDQLREYLTDDLIAEVAPELQSRAAGGKTEVVLLNAELLGIETVSGGHLASIRYSGMLREAPDAEAFRFEEVWNLYKAENEGWLLAGIQQMPTDGTA